FDARCLLCILVLHFLLLAIGGPSDQSSFWFRIAALTPDCFGFWCSNVHSSLVVEVAQTPTPASINAIAVTKFAHLSFSHSQRSPCLDAKRPSSGRRNLNPDRSEVMKLR